MSTDLQRDKDTIATQKDLIEQFCASNGYTLTEIYADDGVSGTTHLHERSAANQMLLDAHREVQRLGGLQGRPHRA